TGASDLTWQITLRGVSPGPTAATGPAPGPAPADGRGWREPRPQDYQDVGASQAPPGYVVSAIKASSTPGATALLIEDVMPWGTTANEAVLNANRIAFDEIPSRLLASTDLTRYRLVIVAGGQTFEYGYMAGEDPGLILRNLIPYAHALAPAWLSVSETAGHIPAGGHADIGVVFDATGQFGGDYRLDVVIASNDPDESEVTVPASLHVTGAPDVALSRSALDYGTLFVGLALAETLVVSNAGTDRLTVSGISASRAEYTTDAAGGFSLAPRESRAVVVTFRPVAAGPAPGTLTLRSDDPDEAAVPVALTGTGLPPPDIAVSPASP